MNKSAGDRAPLIAQVLIEIEGQIDRSRSETGANIHRSDPLPVSIEVVIEDRYAAEGWASVEFRETPQPLPAPGSGYHYHLALRR